MLTQIIAGDMTQLTPPSARRGDFVIARRAIIYFLVVNVSIDSRRDVFLDR